MHVPTRVPTIVGLLLIFALVGTVSFVSDTITRQTVKASLTVQPREIQVTNITNNGFTVSWITDSAATGLVEASAAKQKTITAFDERDTSGTFGKYTTHSLVVRGAAADTEYSVKILSSGNDFGKTYPARTFPTINGTPSAMEPAYGTIVTSGDQPAEAALVYISFDGTQTLSTLTKPSGSWLIPVNLIRSEDGADYVPIYDKSPATVLVRYGNEVATATTFVVKGAPIPTIAVGKNYDFRQRAASKTPPIALAPTQKPQPSESPAVMGVQTTVRDVSITNPKDGAALTSALPLFQGTGVPGKSVLLTVGISYPTAYTTTVASDGLWRLTPTKPVGIGRQSLTITTQDKYGKTVALTNTFEILKSGTQVLGDATPSGTLAPTPTETPLASASPTAIPTELDIPTPTSTLAGQPLPTSGTILPTLMLIIIGIGLLTGGTISILRL